jgi:hypothetical protein
MQPAPSECPLFDRPKRGRKKPHQPALTHCVRVAGRDALRLTALPRAGAANRNSLGHLRWPRSNIDSRRAPLRRSAVRDTAPRKARKTNRRQNERKAGRRYRFFLRRKGSRLGEDLNPRLGLGYGGMGRGRGRSFGLKDPPMLADWIGSGRRTYRGRSESLSRLPARVAHRLWTEAIGLEPERASACT